MFGADMSDTAIRVEGLGKQYRIGSRQESYKTLRDTLTDSFTAPFRRLSSVFGGHSSVVANETIWALRDVSLEVRHGSVIGIIGRNGAGKTTLLKILSRITEPTEGYAEIHGRVGSLLEVGTGFHPELTGRENIYLNGAILGMRRVEINRKFDDIVAFAEVEKFIETPVKHYSSGMYVRLAFAVAAHLDSDILLVDEVLAVGDAVFQRKCLNKMDEVTGQGRTVLFVSHNMPSVESLCDRTIVLADGKVTFDGSTREAIDRYLSRGGSVSADVDLQVLPRVSGADRATFQRLRILDRDGCPNATFRIGDQIVFELELDVGSIQLKQPTIAIAVETSQGLRVCFLGTDEMHGDMFELTERTKLRCTWESCELLPGTYYLKLGLRTRGGLELDTLENAAAFHIEGTDFYGSGKIQQGVVRGIISPRGHWQIEKLAHHAESSRT